MRLISTRDVEAVENFLLPLSAPLEVSCFQVCFRFLTLRIFWLPLPAPDKVGRFRVRFRSQLILSKRFRFLQNFTTSSFRFLSFLSNGMLTAQHKAENL